MVSLTPNELPKIQKAIIKSITRLRLPGEQQQTHPLRQQTLFLPAYERCPPQTHLAARTTLPHCFSKEEINIKKGPISDKKRLPRLIHRSNRSFFH